MSLLQILLVALRVKVIAPSLYGVHVVPDI